MKNKRTIVRVVAGAAVATGLFLGAATPAQAFDTGWNGTRIAPSGTTK